MYLITIILPLIASIVSGFFGRKIGVNGSQLITNCAIMLTTMISVVIFFEVGLNNTSIHLQLFKWIDSEMVKVYWGFNFDSLTASMLIPVLTVSFLVHMYSIGYMSHDPHNQRFFSYLSLFTFMMIILVTADNYLLMFVGWEGVGICSYLLVSFWFTRIAANQSSISAFLTNRVGDCFLTIGIFIMIWSFGNVDYSTVFSLSPFINENIITMVGACLLIGAMAKSSQIGLHVWLPQAMEGPTPVSALIHAATMVTAGVYLLMRSSPMIEYSSTILILCVWIGAFTTVFSSLIGLFQQDIKKVIAYSTMSQLGLMVVAVGLSCYNIALFHLVNHAFYKALLFLGAGSVIHAMSDNQDFRKYGSLRSYLPLTYSSMLIASLSLVAFPFMTGFYSKDFILESAYSLFGYAGVAIYTISVIGAVFTTLYSFKILYLTFLASPNAAKIDYHNAKENDTMMSTPLIVLSLFSIFFGFITKDMFVGLGSDFYADNALYIHPKHEITINTEFAVHNVIKLLPFFFTLSFTIYSLYISEFSIISLIIFKYSKLGYNIFSFFNQRFYIELFYNRYITDNVLYLGGQTTKIIDKGTVEMAGPYGLQSILQFISKTISKLDTGVVTSYALYILLGLVSYILTSYIHYQFNILVVVFCLILLSVYNTIYPVVQERLSASHPFVLISLKNHSIFYIKNSYTYFFKSSIIIPTFVKTYKKNNILISSLQFLVQLFYTSINFNLEFEDIEIDIEINFSLLNSILEFTGFLIESNQEEIINYADNLYKWAYFADNLVKLPICDLNIQNIINCGQGLFSANSITESDNIYTSLDNLNSLLDNNNLNSLLKKSNLNNEIQKSDSLNVLLENLYKAITLLDKSDSLNSLLEQLNTSKYSNSYIDSITNTMRANDTDVTVHMANNPNNNKMSLAFISNPVPEPSEPEPSEPEPSQPVAESSQSNTNNRRTIPNRRYPSSDEMSYANSHVRGTLINMYERYLNRDLDVDRTQLGYLSNSNTNFNQGGYTTHQRETLGGFFVRIMLVNNFDDQYDAWIARGVIHQQMGTRGIIRDYVDATPGCRQRIEDFLKAIVDRLGN